MVGQVLKAQRRDRAVVWAVILICAAAIGAAKGEDLTSSGWPTRGWSVSSPGAEGLDSGALADLVEWAKAERVDSLLVVRHGKVVLDAYYAPFKSGVRHNLYSATKSFVGTLTAIELRDYFLDSVDHPVLDFFQNKSVTLVDERKKAITVQHLLDMTSGIEWDRGGAGSQGSALKMYKSADPTKFVLDQPMTSVPGQYFYYDNGSSYVLSALITTLTGQNALDFAKRELFESLGTTDFDWGKPDAQNVMNGASHLYLKPSDMAKLGYLYLHNGEWDGRQIIPASWVQRVRSGATDAGRGFRYGNLWWSRPDQGAFMARGSHGQLIVVIPNEDIVAVLTAALPDDDVESYPVDLADYLVKSVRADKDIPTDPKAEARLNAALQSAAAERRDDGEEPPPLAADISGKAYGLDVNPLGLKSLSLNLNGPNPTWSLSRQKSASNNTVETVSGPIGLQGVFPVVPTQEGAPLVKGRWLSATSFEVQSRVLGQGDTDKWIVEFRGASIDLHFENNEGVKAELHGAIRE